MLNTPTKKRLNDFQRLDLINQATHCAANEIVRRPAANDVSNDIERFSTLGKNSRR